MKEKYHTRSHSKSLIKFHFGMVVKYRKPLLFGEMNDDLLLIVQEIPLGRMGLLFVQQGMPVPKPSQSILPNKDNQNNFAYIPEPEGIGVLRSIR
jgi:hypothetical protein